MTVETIYTREMLRLAGSLPVSMRLPPPKATGSAHSRICGSRISVDLYWRNGRISDYGLEVRACVTGQASAALVSQQIVGLARPEISAGRAALLALLSEGAFPSGSPWESLKALEPVRHIPARHEAALLIFDALLEASNPMP